MKLKIEVKPKGSASNPYFLSVLCEPPFLTGAGGTKEAAIKDLIEQYKKHCQAEFFEVELDDNCNLINIEETKK